MTMSNDLDEVYQDFIKLKDGIRIAQIAIDINGETLLENTNFSFEFKDEIKNDLQNVEIHIENWFYITIWSFFEKHLYEFYENQYKGLPQSNPQISSDPLHPFHIQFLDFSKKKVKRWKSDDIIDLLSPNIIDEQSKGEITKFKKFRDTIAHQKQTISEHIPESPMYIYELLSNTLKELSNM